VKLGINRGSESGIDHIRQPSAKLINELDVAPGWLDDKECVVIKEAVEIFVAALNRLELLERDANSKAWWLNPMQGTISLILPRFD